MASGLLKRLAATKAPSSSTNLRRPRPHLCEVRPDLASIPGAFGEPLSREFRGLLDRDPPADQDEVHKLFKEEIGDEPQNMFKSFDEKPFASASIAQVHYATLHSGEEVVVKIQRRASGAGSPPICKLSARRAAVEFAMLGSGCPPRTWSPTSRTTWPRSSTFRWRPSRWTPGCRTCIHPRWARTSVWHRCIGI